MREFGVERENKEEKCGFVVLPCTNCASAGLRCCARMTQQAFCLSNVKNFSRTGSRLAVTYCGCKVPLCWIVSLKTNLRQSKSHI